MSDALEIVEEIGPAILGIALKLYPEIRDLVTGARDRGEFSEPVATTLAQILPSPGASARKAAELEERP